MFSNIVAWVAVSYRLLLELLYTVFWLMVVKSMLSCDVSSTTLSKMLIILFSLLSFFSFGSFCLASSG